MCSPGHLYTSWAPSVPSSLSSRCWQELRRTTLRQTQDGNSVAPEECYNDHAADTSRMQYAHEKNNGCPQTQHTHRNAFTGTKPDTNSSRTRPGSEAIAAVAQSTSDFKGC
jgi:hypothetical protein